jgi:hypothetical protein
MTLQANMIRMDPLLSLQVYHDPAVYRPGDVLRFDYQIDAVEANDVSAIEASLLWLTEGKGDEDLGVHFFERRVPGDVADGDLRPLHTCDVTLPNSPLTYDGQILQVRWLVRVRFFAKGGKEFCVEKPFVLKSGVSLNPTRLLPHD